jgi:SNF2 family DNA or RNA helicase
VAGSTRVCAMSAHEPGSTRQQDLPAALLTLLGRLSGAPAVDPAASALVDRAVAVLRRPGFDTLLSLPQLAFTPFDYQQETAATVLRRMRGRAILADEVGLGKTIEAGLIATELRLRGLADRTLVITPRVWSSSGGTSWNASSACLPRSCPERTPSRTDTETGRCCWPRSPRPAATR